MQWICLLVCRQCTYADNEGSQWQCHCRSIVRQWCHWCWTEHFPSFPLSFELFPSSSNSSLWIGVGKWSKAAVNVRQSTRTDIQRNCCSRKAAPSCSSFRRTLFGFLLHSSSPVDATTGRQSKPYCTTRQRRHCLWGCSTSHYWPALTTIRDADKLWRRFCRQKMAELASMREWHSQTWASACVSYSLAMADVHWWPDYALTAAPTRTITVSDGLTVLRSNTLQTHLLVV